MKRQDPLIRILTNRAAFVFGPDAPRFRSVREDVDRLRPHLSCSRRLNEILVLDSLEDDDLKRMVILEAERDKPRILILKKLVGRITARQRLLTILRALHKQ